MTLSRIIAKFELTGSSNKVNIQGKFQVQKGSHFMQNKYHRKNYEIMKKILSSFLTMMLFTSIFGQGSNIDSTRDDVINHSDYIFEGAIIKESTYLRGNPVKSEIIKVTKVFTGNLSPGTVEIIHYIQSVVSMKHQKKKKTLGLPWILPGLENIINVRTGYFFAFAKEFPRDPRYNIIQLIIKLYFPIIIMASIISDSMVIE